MRIRRACGILLSAVLLTAPSIATGAPTQGERDATEKQEKASTEVARVTFHVLGMMKTKSGAT